MIARLRLTNAALLLLTGMVCPVLAHAQGNGVDQRSPVDLRTIDDIPDSGKAIQPTLSVGFSFDSNTNEATVGGNNSWIGVVAPAVLLSTAEAQRRYALLYRGAYGHFFADSADNFVDHILIGAARYHLGFRGQADFAAAIARQHLNRGVGQSAGLDPTSPLFPTEPDVFDHNRLAGKFHYGAEGNRGRLNAGLGVSQLSYVNNLQRTRFLDYETWFGSAGLSLLFHQRTAFVLDAVFTDIRYSNDPLAQASRNSEDWRFLLGVTWAATAKTVGSIRVGRQFRQFADPTRGKSSIPSWDANVRWSPLEYSHVDFVSSRANEETDGGGSFTDRRIYRLAWTHQWGHGWQSIIRFERRDSEFVDSALAREEAWKEYYLGLRYPVQGQVTWVAGYSRRSRDSNLNSLVFDGNMFNIGVNIGI